LLRQRRTVLLKGRGNAIKQQSETLRTWQAERKTKIQKHYLVMGRGDVECNAS
jgi:hypothetical protein